MDLRLWLLYLLPAGALGALPEVKLEAELGGSVTIKCPLPEALGRMYLCRQMADSKPCATVVSAYYTKDEFKGRVTLSAHSKKHLFLVKMTELTEKDSGVYACGVGLNTDRDKTQKITLTVHTVEYEPFWEEDPMPRPPERFPKIMHRQLPRRFQKPSPASSFQLTSKATPRVQNTKVPAAHRPSPTAPITHQLRVSRASPGAVARPPTLLPSAAKTPAKQVLLRPWTVAYSRHTKMHRQRAFGSSSLSDTGDQGLHILIPICLALLLLALLGLVVKRAVQRRRAFYRRIRRQGVRMRGREANRRPGMQRSRASQRPRSQNNVYSACPRRAREPEAPGGPEPQLDTPGASASPAQPQVSETPWLHTTAPKTSCEYVSICHQPSANTKDPDSDDYVNIPCLTHLPSSAPRPRPWCQ
ncbi:fas apoptotic inhibitory molecule 3 isoform X1 [Ochotona curzoniae]|uniref:fas apoptotic inhibitory molecule 3 isoform X1 n=1 Tax=Ochotona curzoniae TaxID=130825 RepID=UPI001B349F7C|nr:fas apoptotic inhibitory molecule 3 isoform X1 [Ochotona curzoniae]